MTVSFAILAGCILWTAAYAIMLAIAVIFNQGVGGPLAYPVGIIAIVTAIILVGCGVFAPASAVGAFFCKVFGLPRLAAIPVVFGSAFALSYLLYWAYIELTTTHSMPAASIILKNFIVFLSIPLGVYWWLAEGPLTISDALRWIWNGRRKTAKATEPVPRL